MVNSSNKLEQNINVFVYSMAMALVIVVFAVLEFIWADYP